jgi:uncharacterized protein
MNEEKTSLIDGKKRNFEMMLTQEQILLSIKQKVLELIPDADVYLFGSRVNGFIHQESDWDILVLIQQQPTTELKQKLYNNVFPISVSISAFINLIVASRKDWQENPSYFSLKHSIDDNNITI